MKKVMSVLLAAMTIAGVSTVTSATEANSAQSVLEISENPILISTLDNEISEENNLIINGKSINIGEAGVIIKNNIIMVPLKITAEELGFTLSVSKDNNSANLNNNEIETNIYIGEDNYYYSSVNAIGMTQPTSLGAEPIVVDGEIYIPISLYNLLLNSNENTVGSFWVKTRDNQSIHIEQGNIDRGWKLIDENWYYMNEKGIMQKGWILNGGNWYYLFENGVMASDTITPDGYYVDKDGKWDFKPAENDTIESAINPIEEFDDINEPQKVLDFKIKVPQNIPSEYQMKYVNTIARDIIQVCYSDGENEILFRMGHAMENISGDYTIYSVENREDVNGVSVDFYGDNNLVNLAMWTQGNTSYSIMVNNGMTKEQIIDIMKSI